MYAHVRDSEGTRHSPRVARSRAFLPHLDLTPKLETTGSLKLTYFRNKNLGGFSEEQLDLATKDYKEFHNFVLSSTLLNFLLPTSIRCPFHSTPIHILVCGVFHATHLIDSEAL